MERNGFLAITSRSLIGWNSAKPKIRVLRMRRLFHGDGYLLLQIFWSQFSNRDDARTMLINISSVLYKFNLKFFEGIKYIRNFTKSLTVCHLLKEH